MRDWVPPVHRLPFAATLACALLPLAFAPAPARAQLPAPTTAQVSACFTPAQACVGAIVAAIDGAMREVRVQAYGFTALPILAALKAAHARGVDVQVILDKVNDRDTEEGEAEASRGRYTGATYMANAGIPVFIDAVPRIAHNKVIVVDGHLVIGGSYNYTASAEHRNAENVTFIHSPVVAGWFLENWTSRREASREYRAGE